MQSRKVTMDRRSLFALAIAGTTSALLFASTNAIAESAQDSIDFQEKWLVSAEQARSLIADGAIVVDTRVPALRDDDPLPNAAILMWEELSAGDTPPAMGFLDPDDQALNDKLQSVGITGEKVVLAIGDPVNGWGEEGRIAWMLRVLGHPRAAIVDGGYAALAKGGLPEIQAPATPGTFKAERNDKWEIVDRAHAKQLWSAGNVVFLDTREPREFEGNTPYGELRGGHVPGAKHLYYKDLMDENGLVLPASAISEKLATLGIGENDSIVAYCTGGVRSAFATSVLQDQGYKAVNYTGSMWDWAEGEEGEFPLEND